MGSKAPKNMALCVFDEQQSWPVVQQASHHPGEAFPMKTGRKHKSPGSTDTVWQLQAAADRRRERHGRVMHTMPLRSSYTDMLTCGARNMRVGMSSRQLSSFQWVSLQGGSRVGATRPLSDTLRPSLTSISKYSDTWAVLKIQSSRQERSHSPLSEG